MIDLRFIALASNLPSEVYEAMIYYAARKLPHGKYQLREFKHHIASCAISASKFYKHKLTKEYWALMCELIRYLGEVFEYRTITCLAEALRQIASTACSTPFELYQGLREKPPPIFTPPPRSLAKVFT